MIHLYRVCDQTTGHQWWCFAYQPVEAKELSVEAGKARNVSDLRLLQNSAEVGYDFSKRFHGSSDILENDRVGVAALKIKDNLRVWVFGEEARARHISRH